MRISADVESCVGSGQCALAAPRLFTQNMDTGLVEVLDAEPSEAERESAELAAMACPVRAVLLQG